MSVLPHMVSYDILNEQVAGKTSIVVCRNNVYGIFWLSIHCLKVSAKNPAFWFLYKLYKNEDFQ